MFTFNSVNRNTQLFIDKLTIRFDNHIFTTEDEAVAETLRNYPEYGKSIFEGARAGKPESNVIQGARTSNRDEVDVNKYIKYGQLQAKLLNKAGEFRKDATEEEQDEFNKLKTELGV